MATSNDLLIKQRSVIEFLAAEGCSAANIHARMKTVYGEMCISDCAVRKWTAHCRDESAEKGHVYSTLRALQRILTGDESWVYHYDPECKAQSMEYRHKTSPSPRKFKVVASARKVLFTVFWDMEGQTVNSERYISTLRALKLRLRRVRRDKDSILQHDNARPHTSRQTQDALRHLELTTLPHPAYSPDLAPSFYYLFPQLKKYLKGHHNDNDEKVIADVCRWCHGQSSEFFADSVRQLVERWRLCVDRDGDYVEKQSAKSEAVISPWCYGVHRELIGSVMLSMYEMEKSFVVM
ncbi:transposase [Plakobranchus ocellatus]|uniref:Transposase n=1 Tax=Plakobranchus ocellatus TaxID=259542 RepID=A0AAV4A663_9GAST|nr:transposase [Plakobranchus ocellatus]